MQEATIKVKGMSCQGCVRSVTNVLSELPGVEGAEVSLERGEARVRYDDSKVGLEQLRGAIDGAGFEAG